MSKKGRLRREKLRDNVAKSHAVFASALEWDLQGNRTEAAKLYRTSLRVDPFNTKAMFNLASIDARNPHQLSRAIREFEDVIWILDPRGPGGLTRAADRPTKGPIGRAIATVERQFLTSRLAGVDKDPEEGKGLVSEEPRFRSIWYSAHYARLASQLNHHYYLENRKLLGSKESLENRTPKEIGKDALDLLLWALETELELLESKKPVLRSRYDPIIAAWMNERDLTAHFLARELEPLAALLVAAGEEGTAEGGFGTGKDGVATGQPTAFDFDKPTLFNQLQEKKNPDPSLLIDFVQAIAKQGRAPWVSYGLACYFAQKNSRDAALDLFEQSLRQSLGRDREAMIEWAPQDPSLKGINREKRFKDLLLDFAYEGSGANDGHLTDLFFTGAAEESLASLHITTADSLLHVVTTSEMRRELAKKLKVEPRLVKRWADIADLMRIPELGPSAVRLLDLVGVGSRRSLSLREPKDLYEEIQAVAHSQKIIGPIPGERTVSAWIREAKRHKSDVKEEKAAE
jgi:hypothetical protein